MLVTITALLDLTGMSMGFWLAFYVLARGYRSGLTQRAFIVLFLAGLFFLGAYNNIFRQVPGSAAWRAMYLIVALFFWYDLTRKLLPIADRIRTRALRWFTLILAASAAITLLVVPNAFRGEVGNALNIGQMKIELPFILYGLFMIEIAVVFIYNQNLIRQAGLAHKHRFFFVSTLIAVINLGHGILSLAILPPQSRIVQDGLILTSMIVLGYSVARHQTFVEKRTTFRDFQVSALTVLGLAFIFGLVGYFMDFSPVEIGVLVLLAVLSLGSYDFIRVALEGVSSRQVNQMRGQLFEIARTVGIGGKPIDGFGGGLETLCKSMEAEGGLIALPDENGYRVLASTRSLPKTQVFGEGLALDQELIECGPGMPDGLTWIAPCTWEGKALALVAIGPRETGGQYNDGDLDLLAEFADQIALLLHLQRLQSTQGNRLANLAAEFQANEVRLQTGNEAIVDKLKQRPDKQLISWVEDGLRNLSDYSYLGRSPLAAQLNVSGDTHLAKGQGIREKILDLLDDLRPQGERPKEPLPREWYSFAVLHDAYVEDVPNREIMARLYISEGTFNRTRRNAIRAIARAIQELQEID